MGKYNSKRSIVILVLLLMFFVSIEITLRKVWGFGETVLFQEDKNFEYIAQPNQNRVRFGNRIVYNEYSMRSNRLNDDDTCVVLGFGDSVINGGALTDQDSLATTLVENQLNGQIRFLNISAGSWGPDNCAQYLKKYGAFNAKMIILFVSSHDAHDNMTFEKIVGHHESYPLKQYPLAIIELCARYIMPRILSKFQSNSGTENLMINKNGQGFNPGFEFFKNFTLKNRIPFIVCLHAERTEVEERKFNTQGDEILQYCAKNNIKIISGLDIGEEPGDFRDGVHINEKGQRRWSMALLKEIQETVKTCY